MSSLDKMWASFTGMGLMVVASTLVLFARYKLKGFLKGMIMLIAFLILLVSVVFMLASMT